MAGHSKFKNTIHRKNSQSKKKAKVFARAVKNIVVAAKLDIANPNFNAKLRNAMIAAKRCNISKNKIDKALDSAQSKIKKLNYKTVSYEGYGPGGVAIVIEISTKNKSKTTSDMRRIFHKHGGFLVNNGNVRYMFKKIGLIIYKTTNINKIRLINAATDLEIDDYIEKNNTLEITSSVQNYFKISKILDQNFAPPTYTGVRWIASQFITIDKKTNQQLLKFLDALYKLNNSLIISSNHKIINI